VKQCAQKMKEINDRILALQKEFEEVKAEYERNGLIGPVYVGIDYQGKIAAALDHNAAVDRAASVLETFNKRKSLNTKYEELTSKIESIDLEKEKALQSAKMPIEGLSVTEDAVTYNKIPFHQLSSAEKLKVSMAIAMAMNPELRVIRILDGSLLDEDNMKVIEQMAKDQDYQVWVEVVDSSGKVGFYVEDGEIQNMNL